MAHRSGRKISAGHCGNGCTPFRPAETCAVPRLAVTGVDQPLCVSVRLSSPPPTSPPLPNRCQLSSCRSLTPGKKTALRSRSVRPSVSVTLAMVRETTPVLAEPAPSGCWAPRCGWQRRFAAGTEMMRDKFAVQEDIEMVFFRDACVCLYATPSKPFYSVPTQFVSGCCRRVHRCVYLSQLVFLRWAATSQR